MLKSGDVGWRGQVIASGSPPDLCRFIQKRGIMDINEFLYQYGFQLAMNDEGNSFDDDFRAGIGCFIRAIPYSCGNRNQRAGYEAARHAARIISRLRQEALNEHQQLGFFD